MQPSRETAFPRILAHAGGGAHAPHNTLAAFRQGLTDGADGFECDVHLSRDGIPVVTHDFALERVAGVSAPVAALTAAELRELDVGSWFDPGFSDQYVPTLAEVLTVAEGRHLLINIEIKAGYRMYPGIEEACLRLVAELGGDNDVVFSSFDHYCLRRLKEIDSQAVTGALHGCSLIDAHLYAKEIGVDALHPQYQVVDAAYVAGCTAEGLDINTWTVNDSDAARQVKALGVSAIITDDPALVRECLTSS